MILIDSNSSVALYEQIYGEFVKLTDLELNYLKNL